MSREDWKLAGDLLLLIVLASVCLFAEAVYVAVHAS